MIPCFGECYILQRLEFFHNTWNDDLLPCVKIVLCMKSRSWISLCVMFVAWYPSNFIDSHFVQTRMLGEEKTFLLGLLIFIFSLLFMFLSYVCRVTLFVFKLLHHKSEKNDRVWSWIVVCGRGPGHVCQNFIFDISTTILIATGWKNVNVLKLATWFEVYITHSCDSCPPLFSSSCN